MMIRTNTPGLFNRTRASKADRPFVKPEMAPTDWLMEAAAMLGLLFTIGLVVYHYPRLPDTVPSHFNGAGLPDDYAPKSSFLILPGIDLFVYILLTLIVLIPHQFNYAVKITPGNALKQYTMALNLIRYLKAAIIWLFFYISYATIRVAAREDSGLGVWFVPIILCATFIPLIIYLVMSFRNR